MRVLVTGHEGFIGKNMVQHLTAAGHEVCGYEYDLHESPDVSSYDWVVHLGAISSTTERDVEKVLRQNLDFSVWLLHECEAYGVNLQYASSASVYGPGTTFNERSPVYPQSPYAWSKYMFERHAQSTERSITVQGFRYFNVYGHHEEHKGAQASPVTKFTQQARKTGAIEVFRDSEFFLRDFVCVDDVCRVHSAMLQCKESGVWNVGTGHTRSFMEIAEAVAKKEGARIKEIQFPPDLTQQYQRYTQADNQKINKIVKLDWIDVLDWIRLSAINK